MGIFSHRKVDARRHVPTMRWAPSSIMQVGEKLTETNSRVCICRRRHNLWTYLLRFIFLSPLALASPIEKAQFYCFVNFCHCYLRTQITNGSTKWSDLQTLQEVYKSNWWIIWQWDISVPRYIMYLSTTGSGLWVLMSTRETFFYLTDVTLGNSGRLCYQSRWH